MGVFERAAFEEGPSLSCGMVVPVNFVSFIELFMHIIII